MLEKGIRKELVERMKRDLKMMKGKYFDQKLTYYWGRKIMMK